MTAVPEDLSYTAEHEWLSPAMPGAGVVATVGITESAATQLGDLVFVDPPAVGTAVTAGSVCGEVESTKSVSELYSPVSGTVVEINQGAVDDPAVVNSDPYGAGWLFKVEVSDTGALLTADEYRALTSA
jgi:glycine cleavage system H protein